MAAFQQVFRLTVVVALTVIVSNCKDENFTGNAAKKSSSKNPATTNNPNSNPANPANPNGTIGNQTPNIPGQPPGGIPGLPSNIPGTTGSNKPGTNIGILTSEGVQCTPDKQGYVGKVYKLQPQTAALPNLVPMTPIGQIEALQLNVPDRSWEKGFPGVPSLNEWFAVRFIAALQVPVDGVYEFKTTSDDGSKLYIEDVLVVNNDGIHAPKSVTANSTLKAGPKKIVVEWYQGPKRQIALQVYWKKPGSAGFEIIPATALITGKDCNLPTIGTFP